VSQDRWRPTIGARVRVTPRPKAPDDEPPPPLGVWRILDRAPERGTWWLQAADSEARLWLAAHPKQNQSGCIVAEGTRLKPHDRLRV
jgi:hypothetical protein